MIDGHGDDLFRYEGIRMNFSSNIYGHADLSALYDHLRCRMGVIGSYPEPSARSLEVLLADLYGVRADEVMVTSGATDAIWLVAQAFRHLHTFRVLTPTFSEYEDACRAFGYQESDTAALCWLCNPNNPTGQVRDDEEVMALACRHEWLVTDQSYEDYTLAPVMAAREALRHGHIVQIRSMTKDYAVPGLRLGFIIAPAAVVDTLRGQYRPWAVNALALEAGKWLLREGRKAIPDLPAYLAEAQRLCGRLRTVDGIEVTDTQTNFMLCRLSHGPAAALKDHLAREKGMLIRDASNIRGLSPHHFRVTAQLPEENDALADAVSEYMEDLGHGH